MLQAQHGWSVVVLSQEGQIGILLPTQPRFPSVSFTRLQSAFKQCTQLKPEPCPCWTNTTIELHPASLSLGRVVVIVVLSQALAM